MPRKAANSQALEALDFNKSLQKLTPERFFRFIREYPAPDATSVYIYRLVPVIDRGLAGVEESNIDSTTALVDEEYILRTHGSGKYHLKYSDGNKPRGLTEVAKTTVEVWDPNVDPILNPVELVVSAPGNDKWVRKYLAKGWTVENGKLIQPPSGSEAGVLAKTVSDLAERVAARPAASEAGNDVVRRALDVLTDRNRGDELETAFKIADRLRPQPDPTQTEVFKLVTELLTDRARPAETNPIIQLKETAALLREFGWSSRTSAAPPAGTSWADLVAALPGIFQHGSEFLGRLLALRAAGVQAPAAAVPSNPNSPGTPPAEVDMTLNALMSVGRDALEAFQRGIDGDDFAHALVCRNRAGEELYATLVGMGKDGLLTAISMVPGLAEQIAPKRAEMEAWLDKFMSYGQDPEPGEGQKAA